MFNTVGNRWDGLSVAAQDTVTLLLFLLPVLVLGAFVIAGYRPFALVGAMLWRFRWTNLVFVILIAVSVGLGVALIAQERGLRQGTARAAEKFDLVVTAPGSEVTMTLAAVYLQPTDAPLLSGDIVNEISQHPNVTFAAPLAFGDSYRGAPTVGTTADLVTHLSGTLQSGRLFDSHTDAVIGSAVPLALDDTFAPAHGVGHVAEDFVHHGFEFKIVGKMRPTGTPWDSAILVSIEAIWKVHGLSTGHALEDVDRLGPPFDASRFPGTPAVVVQAEQLWANYALREEFTRADTMAFFPGAVLSQLHSLLGDVRQAMSIMAIITQILVAVSVLAGLVILIRLFARRLALLRALGSPRRFVFAVVWCYAATLIILGASLGMLVGYCMTYVISRMVSDYTLVLVQSSLGWPEFHLVAAFVSVSILIALVPAIIALRRPVLSDLRS